MRIYTYSDARQRLSLLLEEARKEGGVRIRRRDGQTFVLRPEKAPKSPLSVGGPDLDLSPQEIVDFVRQSRR